MLEKIRAKWQKRIERNTFKSQLSWKDTKGEVHNETVFFKRSLIPLIGDWTRIYPPIDEYGKVNRLNLFFGGKKNLIILLLVGSIVALALLGFSELLTQLETIHNNPCFQTCMNSSIQLIMP